MFEKLLIGIDIGGTKCSVVLGDMEANVRKKIIIDTTTYEETIEKIMQMFTSIMSSEVAAIGISYGGPLDSSKGMILSPPNLPGWDEVPIVKMLEGRFGVPAF